MSLHLRRIIAVAVLLTASLSLSGCGGEVVPDVTGLRIDAAQFVLEREGFRIEDVEHDADAKGPVGTVVRQKPGVGGRLPLGSGIDLVVSGPDLVYVPWVVGRTIDEAHDAIDEAGLRRGRFIEEYSDVMPEGKVISQELRAGTKAPRDTKLEVRVSLGPKSAAVPGVVGRNEEDVRQFLYDLGFKSRVDREFNRMPEGVVLGQFPDARTELDLGERVEITVSKGPEMRVVPDVRGMSAEDAARKVSAAGLAVIIQPLAGARFTGEGNKVVATQQPYAGFKTQDGTLVVVYVEEEQ